MNRKSKSFVYNCNKHSISDSPVKEIYNTCTEECCDFCHDQEYVSIMENEQQLAKESTALITTAADENTPTQPKNRKLKCKKRCNWKNFCISSNSALMILLWSFLISLCYNLACYPESYSQIFFVTIPVYVQVSLFAYGGSAFVYMFYPLAGFLGDVKCGRFKMVKTSLKLTTIAIIALIIIAGIITGAILLMTLVAFNIAYIIVAGVLSSIGFCFVVVLLTGLVCFFANIIQFGMDQLHDSPAQDSSLFIHWFIWVFYTSMVIVQLPWIMFYISTRRSGDDPSKLYIPGLCITLLIVSIVVVLVIISLCVVHHRQRWFLIEPGLENPYKKVYRVTKFARQHKIPVRRSAFTYCEDEIPSGLDLGKQKYGGPFTTEQVEDVKTFYGILKVLFSIGPAFALETATNSMLPFFANNWFYTNIEPCIHTLTFNDSDQQFFGSREFIKTFMIGNSLISPLLIAVLIPLYLYFFRRIVFPFIPGMLKRMGIGMILSFPSLLCFMVVEIIMRKRNVAEYDVINGCYDITNSTALPLPLQDTSLLVIHYIMSALSRMLLYIGMFEFICSQSPHSMKGLLIGLAYAIKGLFQLLAVGLATPFVIIKNNVPALGYGYYITNLALGIIAFIVYAYTAWKYKNRVRDEPSKERQYAEDYYSNIQEEPNYDYSVTI